MPPDEESPRSLAHVDRGDQRDAPPCYRRAALIRLIPLVCLVACDSTTTPSALREWGPLEASRDMKSTDGRAPDAAVDAGPDAVPDVPTDAALRLDSVVVDASGPRDAGLGPLEVVEVMPVVLAAWDSGERLYFAGGEPGPAGGLLAYTEDGVLHRAQVPPGPALWWVWGISDDLVWSCGAGGRILALRDGRWVEESTGLPEGAVLWGLWGSGPRNLWAVGGSPRPDGPKGIVMRSQGDGVWYRVQDGSLPDDVNLFKVWGASRDEVHIVGERGVAVLHEPSGYHRVHTGVDDQLTTVHGTPGGAVYAVGGLRAGVALRWSGAAWVDVSPRDTPPLSGIYVREDGVAIAVGRGAILTRAPDDTSWRREALEPGLERYGFHAVHAARTPWIVGGRLELGRDGVILTRAPAPDPALGPAPPLPDAAVPDAAIPIDAGRVDVAFEDAVIEDAVAVDGPPVDAVVQAPDAAREGVGEPCEGVPCQGNLQCWSFAGIEFALHCTYQCTDVSQCGAPFADPCCGIPGPNVLVRVCGDHPWFRPGDCGDE